MLLTPVHRGKVDLVSTKHGYKFLKSDRVMLSSLLCSVVEALMRTRVCVCVIRYLYGHKAYSMTYRSGQRRQATDVFTQVHYVQQQNKTEAASELHITLEVRGRTTAHAFSVTALFKV